MPLPTFAPVTAKAQPSETMNRTQASSQLGLNGPSVDKMIKAGMLVAPIRSSKVRDLTKYERLRVTDGELTVLRADARAESDPVLYPDERRRWIGFHVEHTDEELEASSLRWWRCNPERVLDNELLVVTVATFPVALYLLEDKMGPLIRPGENQPRYGFTGRLLARVSPGMEITHNRLAPGHLQKSAKQIMRSRIAVSSGGPIGYLEAETVGQPVS